MSVHHFLFWLEYPTLHTVKAAYMPKTIIFLGGILENGFTEKWWRESVFILRKFHSVQCVWKFEYFSPHRFFLQKFRQSNFFTKDQSYTVN